MSSRSQAIEVRPPQLGVLGMARMLWRQEDAIFRGAASCGQAWATMEKYEGGRLLDLVTSCGHRIKALFGRALARDGKPLNARGAPTVLFFYGNDMCLARSLEVFEVLRRWGGGVRV